MSQKYALLSGATSLNRVTPLGSAHQLSDGSLVFIGYDPSAGSCAIWHTADRATVSKVGTIPTGTTTGTFTAPTQSSRKMALAVDASDNLFVVGGSHPGSSYFFAAQAWVKQAGGTWTARNVAHLGSATSGQPSSIDVVWCNTGGGTGGAGHLLMLTCLGNAAGRTVDAGVLVALTSGNSASFTAEVGAPGLVNSLSADLSPDGFGATSGLAVTPDTSSLTAQVNAWSMTSGGTPSFIALTQTGSKYAVDGFALGRAVRLSPNLWAVFTPQSTGSYLVARYSSTAQLTAQTSAGTPTNMPLVSVGRGWDVFLDTSTAGRCWVIAYDPSGTGAVYRLPVDLSGGITWGTAASLADTLSPFVSGAAAGLTATKEPRQTIADWLVNVETDATPTYALYGDYTLLNNPPNAPALTGPADSVTIDLTSTNRFSWTFSDPDAGDSQSAFDLRYSSDGGSTWTTVSGTTPNQYVDVASGTFAAGSYEWRVRTYDSRGSVSSWSSSRFFTAATPPAAVTITAPVNGATISTPTVLVQWSTPAQDAYQVRTVADDGAGNADSSTIYTDTGTVTVPDARSATVAYATNGITVHTQVRIKKNGLWSSYADVSNPVSYTPPATPTVAVAVVQIGGKDVALSVTATHPAPTGSQPTVAYVDIYRRKVGDASDGARYATQQAAGGTWTDYRVASGQGYEYRVLAVGGNGTATYSAWTA